MIFSCTKNNLQRGLSIVSHVSGKQINLPVLQNVHIKAEGGSIVLSTTNLEIAVRTSIRGKIDKQGEFTVPAKLFSDFVNLLPEERVDIELVDNGLNVSCGDTSTSINGQDASEFPLIPSVETKIKYAIPVADFRQAILQVAFAVSSSEARPELSGVLFWFSNDGLVLAATDSYRLAERVIKIGNVEPQRKVIIPSQTVSELARMSSILKEDVESGSIVDLFLSDNQAVFRHGTTELITRTIEGNYPDYRQIVPNTFATEAIVGKNELIKAIKTASLFSRQGIFDVFISVSANDKKITVGATEITRGKNRVSCAADIKGSDNSMTMNYRYILDGLNSMNSEGVTVKIIDSSNPCLIHPNGELENGSQIYIVMPIRQ
jgi:DNA polymerase-3 subunit beta